MSGVKQEQVMDCGGVSVTKTSEVGMVFFDFFGPRGEKLGDIEIVEDKPGVWVAHWYPEGAEAACQGEHLFTVKEEKAVKRVPRSRK